MKLRSARLVAATAALVVAAASLAGCGSDGKDEASGAPGSSQEPQKGGELTVLRSLDIDAWDPDKIIGIESFETLPQVMEGLLRPNPEATGVLPGLAEEWEFDAEAKTITFHLRDGAQFSDGTPVTAEDVAFSVGLWQENVSWQSLYSAISGAKAVDEHTVVVRMNRPSTFTLAWIANGSAVVVPKDFGGKSREEFFKQPIGAGPFQIEEWVPGQSLTLVPNPHYYDPEHPYLDKLTYKVVSDPNQQLLQFQNGQAQVLESVPLDLANQFGDDQLKLVQPTAIVHGAYTNVLSGPAADLHFRKAVSLAIDRETYVQTVFGGLATVAKGGLPPGVEGSAECDCSYDFDLEAAKAELEQSSYDGKPLVILVDAASNVSTRGGEVLVEMLKKVGITADLQPEENSVLFDRYSRNDYDLTLGEVTSISPTVGDIFGLLSVFLATADTSGVIPKAFEALDVAPDPAAAEAATKTAENWMGENLPYVPIANPERAFAVDASVGGLEVAPYLIYPADRLWVK